MPNGSFGVIVTGPTGITDEAEDGATPVELTTRVRPGCLTAGGPAILGTEATTTAASEWPGRALP